MIAQRFEGELLAHCLSDKGSSKHGGNVEVRFGSLQKFLKVMF